MHYKTLQKDKNMLPS